MIFVFLGVNKVGNTTITAFLNSSHTYTHLDFAIQREYSGYEIRQSNEEVKIFYIFQTST